MFKQLATKRTKAFKKIATQRLLAKLLVVVIAVCAMTCFTACEKTGVDPSGPSYWDVAKYIHENHELPDCYISKSEAEELGWTGGNPQLILGAGVYIGGGRYMNWEGLLPDDETYYKCDVDYYDDTRGTNRLVYTKDGEKIYYTDNHYGDTLDTDELTFDEVFVELY